MTSTALATTDNSPAGLLQQYKGDFAQVLPSHLKPDVFVRLATGALRRDPKLAEAAGNNVAAFLGAVLDAARLGHEPGTENYYLVPRKRKGRLEIQGIEGYTGIIERIYRAGGVASVVVETVHEADKFEWRPGSMDRPLHDVDWFGANDRGPLVGVYAYCVMTSGATSKVVVLNKAQVMAAKAKSDGASSDYSPWKTNEESMWLKTAARQLRKWVPTSAEFREEVARAQAAASDVTAAHNLPPLPADPDTGEIHDAEVVDDGHAFIGDEDFCETCGQPIDAAIHG